MMKRSLSVLMSLSIASLFAFTTFMPGAARADATLSFSIGEGVYFMDDGSTRGPVSLELVPSLGGEFLKFDLGLYVTLEELEEAKTDRNFIFRPGIRLTPFFLPLYLRAAIPMQVTHDFDWGFMFGAGLDLPVAPAIGIMLEADTFLTKQLSWGGDGVPLEFRAGVVIGF